MFYMLLSLVMIQTNDQLVTTIEFPGQESCLTSVPSRKSPRRSWLHLKAWVARPNMPSDSWRPTCRSKRLLWSSSRVEPARSRGRNCGPRPPVVRTSQLRALRRRGAQLLRPLNAPEYALRKTSFIVTAPASLLLSFDLSLSFLSTSFFLFLYMYMYRYMIYIDIIYIYIMCIRMCMYICINIYTYICFFSFSTPN